ncbi:hypothetical protein BE11_20700 [Sorangium cellulosum]|nr:hypothetical protein BE11_20700 [Sorangium cellulosum]
MRRDGDADEDVLLGAEEHVGAGPGRVGKEGDGAVGLDADALEEVDGRGQVPLGEAVLGEGEQEPLAAGAEGAAVGVAAVPGGDLAGERGAAEGVVSAGGVLDEGGEDAPHVREEQGSGAGIGLPLELHGVGETEPLDGAVGPVEQEGDACVALDIDDPEPAAGREGARGVAAGAEGLVPEHVARFHARGRVADRRAGHRRLRLDDAAFLGARVLARGVRCGRFRHRPPHFR